jgi:hypothetical protein
MLAAVTRRDGECADRALVGSGLDPHVRNDCDVFFRPEKGQHTLDLTRRQFALQIAIMESRDPLGTKRDARQEPVAGRAGECIERRTGCRGRGKVLLEIASGTDYSGRRHDTRGFHGDPFRRRAAGNENAADTYECGKDLYSHIHTHCPVIANRLELLALRTPVYSKMSSRDQAMEPPAVGVHGYF